jgi:hypothetical protein
VFTLIFYFKYFSNFANTKAPPVPEKHEKGLVAKTLFNILTHHKFMRNFKKISLFLGVLFAVFSCQKNEELPELSVPPSSSIHGFSKDDAKEWIDKQLIQGANSKLEGNTTKRERTYDWSKAKERVITYKNQKHNAVIVPVTVKNESSLLESSALWVVKSPNNEISSRFIEIYNKTTTNKLKDKKDKKKADQANFTGYLNIYDLNGNYEYGHFIENGKINGIIYEFLGEKPTLLGSANKRLNYCTPVPYCPNPTTKTSYWVGNELVVVGYACYTVIQCDYNSNSLGWYDPSTDEAYWNYYWAEIEANFYYNNLQGSGKPKQAITNLNNYLCFSLNSSSNYKVGIFVDQPVNNSRKYVDTDLIERRAGHTYLMVDQIQNGITTRRYLGFYATGDPRPWSPTHTSIWGNDSNSEYDVSVIVDLGSNHVAFGNFVGTIIQMAGTDYDLYDFNCTDAGIKAFQSIGVKLPDTYGNWIIGGGTNPADLAQDLRYWQANDNRVIINTQKGVSGTNLKPCN